METIDGRLKGRNILIVDDNAPSTFALVSYLDGMEMNIYTAEDGLQAIMSLDTNSNIEMVLMDMKRPRRSGN